MSTGKKRKRHGPSEIVKKPEDADRLLNAGKSLGEVLQALGTAWRVSYDERRPHMSLGYRTPAEFARACAVASDRPGASPQPQQTPQSPILS